ncbi:hypothetical protein ACTXT7_017513 [Hymenolepis weldensis]
MVGVHQHLGHNSHAFLGEECLRFFSEEEAFDQDEEVNRRSDRWLAMCLRMPLKFQLLCMCPQVSADVDAYVETLQTIVVKPPWTDRVANGGRPYVFQLHSAPSHKALKTQNLKDG